MRVYQVIIHLAKDVIYLFSKLTKMKKLKLSLFAAAAIIAVSAAASTASTHRVPTYGVIGTSGTNYQLKGTLSGTTHIVADLSTKVQGTDYVCSATTDKCGITSTSTPTQVGTSNVWIVPVSSATTVKTGVFTALTF